MTWSRAAGATRALFSTRISARVFVDSGPGTVADSSSGSGGSTCSQLLSASASPSAFASASASTSVSAVSAEVSVTLTHVTPASEGVSVPALLLSLASPVFLASLPAASEESSAATGAAFSSLTGSTTESSALAFSVSPSASASLLSSSSLSFSYIYIGQRTYVSTRYPCMTFADAPPFLARVLSLPVPS
jgi:hypothetical protein